MDNKNLEELTSFIAEQFTQVHAKLDDLSENKADKSDVHKLLDAVDAYATKANTYFMEMAALSNKINRHEKWIEKLAEKVGAKLDY